MKNLRPYEDDPIANFDAIAGAKLEPTRSVLIRLRPLIERLYRRYAKKKRRLAIMGPHRPLSPSDTESLLHCWSPTEALTDLKEKIRNLQPEPLQWICQYCGLNESNTWDHYLPQAEFPEFTVYAPNLVPCCHDCNERRQVWVDRGARTTIHLYYDVIDPRRPLVNACIDIEDGLPKVTFSLGKVPARSRIRKQFARHWNTLGLAIRFRHRASRILAAIRTEIQVKAGRQTAEEIMEDLHSIARERLMDLGPNHVEAVLYRAAASSRALVDYWLNHVTKPSVMRRIGRNTNPRARH